MHTPVTPTLYLGTPPPGDDVHLASTVQEAVALIEGGKVAVLPAGAWELAEQVLSIVLHGNVRQARERVQYARRMHADWRTE